MMSFSFGVSKNQQGSVLRVEQKGVALQLGVYMVLGALLFAPGIALASTAGGAMPWAGILGQIVNFLQGDVAKWIATILVIFLGFLIAFGEIRGFLGLFLRVSFGLSLVFSAYRWIALFFGH